MVNDLLARAADMDDLASETGADSAAIGAADAVSLDESPLSTDRSLRTDRPRPVEPTPADGADSGGRDAGRAPPAGTAAGSGDGGGWEEGPEAGPRSGGSPRSGSAGTARRGAAVGGGSASGAGSSRPASAPCGSRLGGGDDEAAEVTARPLSQAARLQRALGPRRVGSDGSHLRYCSSKFTCRYACSYALMCS
jgi:hypothetical protein